jgi:predicted Zn-dependent peptidase
MLLSDVLSSQRGSLYELVPQGKALYAGFNLSTLPEAALGYAVVAFGQGADAQPLLAETRKILTEDIKNGFPADLIEAAKRQEVTNAQLQKNSVQGLAMAWSQAVAVEGRRSPDDDIEAVQRVTPEDVNRVARQYLDLDNAIVAVLTPQPSGQAVAAKPPGGIESFTPEHAKTVKPPEWAAKALKRLSIPKSALKPVVNTLPNGLLLVVQPTSISQTVSVYGHIRNKPQMETPKGQEGVDKVLEQLFAHGTTSLDRLAFQAALDEIGASELEIKRTRGIHSVQYACDPSKVTETREIIVWNLKRMQSEPLGEEDLHWARALLIRNIPLSESSVDSIAQKYISLVDLDLPLDEPTRAAQNYLRDCLETHTMQIRQLCVGAGRSWWATHYLWK